MTTPAEQVPAGSRGLAERWFEDHGLPYFVESTRADVAAALGRRRLVVLAATSAVLAAAVGVGAGLWAGDGSVGVSAGAGVAVLRVGLYALTALRGAQVARWAARRTLSSLGLLFPLVTRALPMLLLFVTFLFINAEVWQVASRMDDGVLWVSVLLFAAVAVGFLMVRLPEELDRADGELDAEHLTAACQGTPLAEYARLSTRQVEQAADGGAARMTGLARANLLLVLLVSQALQVLLLAVAVFVFFLVFGIVAIDAGVVRSWTGDPPTWVIGDLPVLSLELARVSVFLAAFSGLYFTVYAVSDETYRAQFFASLLAQLERAVGVLAVYRTLPPETGQTETGPAETGPTETR
jgi:hypothetical protein